MAAKTIPGWQLKLVRRFPRISYVAPVAGICGDLTFTGRSRNLSAGGMLMEADCQIPPRTPLYVSFQLPTGPHVKAVARVVHSRPGRRLGIEFTHMGNADRNALGRAIEIKESYQRRSIRIPERLMVELHWNQEGTSFCQPAQTILLSRHGCLLICEAALPAQTPLVIWCVERRMGAAAHVVTCGEDGEGLAMVALEFARDANFWGIDLYPYEGRSPQIEQIPTPFFAQSTQIA